MNPRAPLSEADQERLGILWDRLTAERTHLEYMLKKEQEIAAEKATTLAAIKSLSDQIGRFQATEGPT